MKRTIFLSFLLFCMVFVCNAQIKLEVNSEGKYRAQDVSRGYVESNISADSVAMKYVAYFSQAVASPMSFVSAKKTEEIKKMIAPLKALREIKEEGLVYNPSTNEIVWIETRELKEEKSFLLIPGLISILFMILFQVFNKRNRITFFVVPFLLAAAAAAFIAAAFTAGTITIFFAAFVAIIFTVGILYDQKKSKSLVVAYYVAMTAYFVLMFVGR